MLWWKNLQLLQLQLQQLQERWSNHCHLGNLQGPYMPSIWYLILWASEQTFSPHESKASSTLWVCLMQKVVDIEQWWVFGPVWHDLLHLEPYSWRGESLRSNARFHTTSTEVISLQELQLLLVIDMHVMLPRRWIHLTRKFLLMLTLLHFVVTEILLLLDHPGLWKSLEQLPAVYYHGLAALG